MIASRRHPLSLLPLSCAKLATPLTTVLWLCSVRSLAAMIKYYATAAGRSAGFIQYEEELKTWDHACGLICVSESGGEATDCEGGEVCFPDRLFPVKGGVVCASKWATPKMKAALRTAATRK